MILENGKIWLMDLTFLQLEDEMVRFGEKKFRAGQIWNLLYVKGVKSFDQMSNISKEVRQKLHEAYDISRLKISSDNLSKDGTRKWLENFMIIVKLKWFSYQRGIVVLYAFLLRLVVF